MPEGPKKVPVRIGHLADNLGNEHLSGCQKVFPGDRLVGHVLRAAENSRNISLRLGGKNLKHRAVVTEHVDDKRAAQAVVYYFVCEQVAYIKKIARMLAIKREAGGQCAYAEGVAQPAQRGSAHKANH